MPVEKVLSETEQQMKRAVEFLKQEYRGVRTGRASAGLVDGLKVHVESYGSTMSMKELGAVAVAEGNVIVIKPYDPSTLKDIQKAIESSELGINPQNDGKMIRLPVPALSTERRNQLAQHVKKLAEAQKTAVRNLRRDANKLLDTGKKDKTMTEDDCDRGQECVQKLTDSYCKELDTLCTDKSKDIMEV
ncbi:MAG: ribosome recycling factor [Phycisphaerae bacterium]|nr:ribosome recycling factor [Phycisphaerae bacterium]